MSEIGYGPLDRIDGPLPVPPLYGLLPAADAPASGVRIIPDADAGGVERWLNGVEVFPYPPGPAAAFNGTCQPGSLTDVKNEGASIPTPQFGPMTIYLAENCTSYRIWDQAAFRARVLAAFAAVESAAVAKEFLTGGDLELNPHLADGNGTFPNGNTATSAVNAVALLEKEIAASGKMGLIHVPPQVMTVLAAQGFGFDRTTGVWRSPNGNILIPDAGYANGGDPTGHTGAGGTQDWVYATGPIDLRRTEMFVNPGEVSQALDRAANKIVYRAERYYLPTWDREVQAAVLVDRCKVTC